MDINLYICNIQVYLYIAQGGKWWKALKERKVSVKKSTFNVNLKGSVIIDSTQNAELWHGVKWWTNTIYCHKNWRQSEQAKKLPTKTSRARQKKEEAALWAWAQIIGHKKNTRSRAGVPSGEWKVLMSSAHTVRDLCLKESSHTLTTEIVSYKVNNTVIFSSFYCYN